MYVWHAQEHAEAQRSVRTSVVVLAGIAVLAAAALSTATAKLQIDLSEPPAAMAAGDTWQADLRVKRGGLPVSDVKPMVTLTDGSGITHLYMAEAGSRPGAYKVKILLPDQGSWTYEVWVGSRVYERGGVHTKPPLLAP
jgi:hypothetical protein